MKRITEKNETGYVVPEQEKEAALCRLGKFEDLWQELEREQLQLRAEMEQLRAAGKQNTVKFKEKMVKKLNNATMLTAFQGRGL